MPITPSLSPYCCIYNFRQERKLMLLPPFIPPSLSKKHVDQDRKWDKVQMIQRTFSVHMTWDKLTHPCFNRSICQGVVQCYDSHWLCRMPITPSLSPYCFIYNFKQKRKLMLSNVVISFRMSMLLKCHQKDRYRG